MKKKRATQILAAAAVMTACFSMTAQAGWEQDAEGRYSYLMDSGAWARDQILEIDGVQYGFDSGAYMLTGWGQMNGEWYYFEPSGAMVKGWKDLGGTWYFMDRTSGAMKTGKFYVGNTMYIADSSGALHVNGLFDGPDGYAYMADASGAIYRNTTYEYQDGTGVILKFEDDGKIRVRNSSTRNIAKAEGGSSWSEDYVTMSNFASFKEELVSHADDAIESVKEELAQDYADAKEDATTSKERARMKKKWENRVQTKLEALSVSESDISSFISEVENGTYMSQDELEDWDY